MAQFLIYIIAYFAKEVKSETETVAFSAENADFAVNDLLFSKKYGKIIEFDYDARIAARI